MQAQFDLFTPQRARRTDPSTSQEAAAKASGLAAQHQWRIWGALLHAGKALGAEQIADVTGLVAYQVRKRLPEMQKQGWVALAEGERKTSSGRSERLWRLI